MSFIFLDWLSPSGPFARYVNDHLSIFRGKVDELIHIGGSAAPLVPPLIVAQAFGEQTMGLHQWR